MLDWIIFLIAIISIVISLISLISLIIIKQKKDSYADQDDILRAFINEFTNRIDKLEGRIIDVKVGLDINEMRIEKVTKIDKISLNKVNSTFDSKTNQKELRSISRLSRLNITETNIITAILNGNKSTKRIQDYIKKTREHTARLLKKLYEENIVIRSSNRPFTYEITDKAKKIINQS